MCAPQVDTYPEKSFLVWRILSFQEGFYHSAVECKSKEAAAARSRPGACSLCEVDIWAAAVCANGISKAAALTV